MPGKPAARGRGNADLFLRSSREIQQAKRSGRRVVTNFFNLLISRAESSSTKFAIIVGKRFGSAVRRNRAKRQFRELGRAIAPHLVKGHYCLVFPKRESLTQPFPVLYRAWVDALRKCRLVALEGESKCEGSVSV